MTPAAKNSISVIIPVHGVGTAFVRCLEGLASATPAPDEIIVVADGGTEGAVREVSVPGARVVAISGPEGPGRARNAGARAARGDILVFIDADVVVHADAVRRIRSAFEADPRLAAVIGSYDDQPADAGFLSQYRNLLHHYVHQTGREDASTFWGACGAIRREVFLALGGFHERYREASIEDVELGYRLKAAGHHIRLDKTLQVTHLKRWDAGSLLRVDIRRRAIPWTELSLREGHFINDLNLKISSRLSVVLVYGMVVALSGGWWWRGGLALGAVCAMCLLALNAPLYLFFWRKRGVWFALRTVPWHWFYYLYSGLAFVLGVIRYIGSRRGGARPRGDVPDTT